MNSASSLTQPSSAEPRVCCQVSPRKYRPGTSVTPRRWRTRPSESKTGSVDPGVVGSVARRPDHGVDVELAAVRERRRRARGADDARLELDAVGASSSRGLEPISVSRSRSRRPSRDSTVLLMQPGLRQPPEEVAAEQPLRQRCLPRADREVNRVGRRRAPWRSGSRCCRRRRRGRFPRERRSAAGSPCCASGRRPARGRPRTRARGRLERAGRDHDLVGLDRPWSRSRTKPPFVDVSDWTALLSWTGSSKVSAYRSR